MEEWVGSLWDRFIRGVARRDHPEAAVHLADLEKLLGVLFRALGGDAGLRVAPAAQARHGARRRLLERIAGSGEKSAHAALDLETLRLPPTLAYFPDQQLNRDLYLWLIALAAGAGPDAFVSSQGAELTEQQWLARNQAAVQRALQRYPGLAPRYRRLVAGLLAERIAPESMPADEAAQEHALRAALLAPGSVAVLPALAGRKSRALQPVPLWLYPSAPAMPSASRNATESTEPAPQEGASQHDAHRQGHQAERTDMPDNEAPFLMMFRAESLLSWGEYVKVNRDTDDDENPDAARTAEGMDQLHIAPDDGKRAASTVRFDLDLPSAAEDDLVLEGGILLPEWDWKRRELRPDYCRLQVMTARDAEAVALPEHLRRPARKLKSQFASLAPARRLLKAQPDGSELDIDACVRMQADRLAGHAGASGAYLAQNQRERNLACLVLADLSLSTDAWVSDAQRVIDVIRDSLMLFGEALSATGDAFAFHGFSSLKRSLVRFHDIKAFDQPFDAAARGRIAALKPGYYTRMGAAIRHATTILQKQTATLRPLLILSDGKPNDIDIYEGRHGIEDTRHALIDARRAGLKPFCVTIDREGAAYLPHLFGPGGFTVLRRPEELPLRLPLLYAQLTGN